MRVAFVGQETFFAVCSLDRPIDGWEPRFFEFRAGADAERLMSALEAYAPDVVVVFRPEILREGLFAGRPWRTLGYLTEPLPRSDSRMAHFDLQRRQKDLEDVDPANVDRIVSFDPMIADSAARAGLRVWRSVALPVADGVYRPVRRILRQPRVLFVGRGTEHREAVLGPSKERFDLLHIAFGAGEAELAATMEHYDVGINIHNHPYPSFENRVAILLAAGLLVMSESLSPQHGLRPGLDYLEFEGPDALVELLAGCARFPGLHSDIRVRGRQAAEMFRASRVWARLLADLWTETGPARPPARPARAAA